MTQKKTKFNPLKSDLPNGRHQNSHTYPFVPFGRPVISTWTDWKSTMKFMLISFRNNYQHTHQPSPSWTATNWYIIHVDRNSLLISKLKIHFILMCHKLFGYGKSAPIVIYQFGLNGGGGLLVEHCAAQTHKHVTCNILILWKSWVFVFIDGKGKKPKENS